MVMISNFSIRTAEGREDYFGVHKFGQNSALASSAETIWSAGGLYPWSALASAQTLYVLSTSGSDTGTLEIQGLNANYEPLTETVTMTGLTAVTTSTPFLRVFRCVYRGSTNVGTITVRTVSGSGTVVAQVEPEEAQTLMAVYTIPTEHRAFLNVLTAGVGKNDDANVTLYIRPFGEVFQIQSQIKVYQNTFSENFTIPLFIPQKTDIDVRATTTNANSECSVSFDLIMTKF
jgi:hypothetical protein